MNVVDEYLQDVPSVQRAALEQVRAAIREWVPDSEEAISYSVPAFRYRGKYLIGFSAFKDHLSIFPGSEAIAACQDELKAYKTSKGTVQFTPENPLPTALLKKIVLHRRRVIDSGGR